MKPGYWLVLGSAIVGCAAALGIYLVSKESPSSDHAPRAGSPRMQSEPAKEHRFPISTNTNSRAAWGTDPTALETRRDSAKPYSGFRIHGKPPAGRLVDERAWFASAECVEREANRELEKLRETLDLCPNQQQRIFDIYARNSPSWQPGMLTGGSHGVGVVSDASRPIGPIGSTAPESSKHIADNATDAGYSDSGFYADIALNKEVMALLDDDQRQDLISEELNRRAWWEEILPQLLPPDFPAAAENPAAGLPGGGDTKIYEGPTGILEE